MKTKLTRLFVALALLAAPLASSAENLVVTNLADSGPGTLRSAITNADNGAVITFDPSLSGATITLSNTLTINTNLAIDASALPGALQINGNGSVQIFNVATNTFVSLNSLTITNGYSTNSGGGIYNGGTLTLTNCTLSGNSATTGGGGIWNDGVLTLTNCILSGNSAPYFLFRNGGGIWNSGLLTLNQCTLSGNSGGGIFDQGALLTLNQCTLSGNSAKWGGGIYIYSGTLVMNQCTLSGNSATNSGGGIWNHSGIITLNQCTLSGNSTTGDGGGINNYYDGTLALNQCTLSGNSSDGHGGGIYSGGKFAMTNTIIAGNSRSLGVDIYSDASLTYGGSNLVQSAYTPFYTAGPAPLTNAPDLAPLGNYGGPTQTMPPLPGSPAIDAGSDSATNFFATDQRGYPRLSGAHVDIGAVEVQFVAANPGNPPVLKTPVWSSTGGSNTFQFSFTNVSGADFTALTSTNLALPLTNWTVLGSIPEISSGQYQFTDPSAPNSPQRFYDVVSP